MKVAVKIATSSFLLLPLVCYVFQFHTAVKNPSFVDFACATAEGKPLGCLSQCSNEYLVEKAPRVRVAVFTLIYDEPLARLEMWLRHNIMTLKIQPTDVFIHQFDCSSRYIESYRKLYRRYGVRLTNILNVTNGGRHAVGGMNNNPALAQDFAAYAQFQVNTGTTFQRYLRRHLGYTHVMYSDCDELVLPHPEKYPWGLLQYIQHNLRRLVVTTSGYEVAELTSDAALRWESFPTLQQRSKWYPLGGESKPLLSSIDTNFTAGMHGAEVFNPFTGKKDLVLPAGGGVCGDIDLFLVHMKTVDCKGGRMQCQDAGGPRDSGCGRCYWHVRHNFTLYDIPPFVRHVI